METRRMPSLKEFRNRIDSVKSTRKITKAMQLVAAAKLKRAQDQAEAGRPYASRMAGVIANLSCALIETPDAPLLLKGRENPKKHLLVVFTADRGLCGGFNTTIVRKAREEIVRLEREGKAVSLYPIGAKAFDQLKRLYKDKIVARRSLREVKVLDSSVAQSIATDLLHRFESGEADVVTIVYSQFKNVLTQIPTAQTLIPARESIALDAVLPDLKGALYGYEPSEEEILADLLPRNITTQIFTALLENAAGEQGARMSAMDSATRNAGEMIDKLTLEYNRKRQANITKELIEIISGAEAL
jgi:F-type H+-transporting ATPase subunit gamma